MIGLVLSNGEYREMAIEAANRFRKFTGLNCIIMDSVLSRENVFKAKLEMWMHADAQTVVQFDSDLWFCKKVDLSEFDDRNEFMAALDPGRSKTWGAPLKDSYKHGIDHKIYVNTGLMIYNQRHHDIFRKARMDYEEPSMLVEDFGEQSYVNIAIQTMGFKLGILDDTYNYAPFGVTHDLYDKPLHQPMTVHAMGFTAQGENGIAASKMEALRYYSSKYSYNRDLI